MTVIEVFADVGCPFTHVGLRRFVEHRAASGRHDVTLHVRSWPLEVVNGQPLDAHFIAEEVDDIRGQIAPSLFAGFVESSFPTTFLPALTLAAAAYEQDLATGEEISLTLRDLLFEQGIDIGQVELLQRLASERGISVDLGDPTLVLAITPTASPEGSSAHRTSSRRRVASSARRSTSVVTSPGTCD